MQAKYTGEDVVVVVVVVVCCERCRWRRWRSWQWYMMERIVGLLKWIGEMGCPPFYNHAIL